MNQPEPQPVRPLAVTMKTARAISGLGSTKLYEMIASGELKSCTIGRRRLIDFASLERLVDAAGDRAG